MWSTSAISVVAMLATQPADLCQNGLYGATEEQGRVFYLVTPECFQAMDRSHSTVRLDRERSDLLWDSIVELRLANRALVASSTVARADANRSHRALEKMDAENEALRERLRELQGDTMVRDLCFLGAGIALTALAGWAVGQAAN
ncbi:MAG: hypothetical protein GTO22_14480 [Gemmatimonadales bacterium]|nr:hypothetical protein [Gemmatimonadales bacterium]